MEQFSFLTKLQISGLQKYNSKQRVQEQFLSEHCFLQIIVISQFFLSILVSFLRDIYFFRVNTITHDVRTVTYHSVLLKRSNKTATLKNGASKSEALKTGIPATENCSEKDLLQYTLFTAAVKTFDKYMLRNFSLVRSHAYSLYHF